MIVSVLDATSMTMVAPLYEHLNACLTHTFAVLYGGLHQIAPFVSLLQSRERAFSASDMKHSCLKLSEFAQASSVK